jgi:uncharacterized protein YaiE (UPF0345 family)
MSIKNAEIKKTANVYHGGNVSSRTVITTDGDMKTLGIMLPGVYRFSTQSPERIEITQGQCRIKRAGDSGWSDFGVGESFSIEADTEFEIEVTELLDYLCHYGDA